MIFIATNEKFRLQELENQAFIQSISKVYEDYLEMRLEGYNRQRAFNAAFGRLLRNDIAGEDLCAAQTVESVVHSRLRKRINEIDIAKTWTSQKAAHALLEIVNDRKTPARVRLNAVKELNLMTRITASEKGAMR